MAASPFAAGGTEALSPTTGWSARAGPFLARFRARLWGPVLRILCSAPVASRWLGWFWIQGFVVCTVAVSLCRPPCYPVQDRYLDGAGPLPAWHQPSANEFIPPAGAVLRHPTTLCVNSLASQRKLTSLVSHTAGGEEAAGRVCKDARIDASLRVSVGLEPLPPQPAVGRTPHRSYAATRRAHRPGPGSGSAAPPGRCHQWVTTTGARGRQPRRPAALTGLGRGVAEPPGQVGARRR